MHYVFECGYIASKPIKDPNSLAYLCPKHGNNCPVTSRQSICIEPHCGEMTTMSARGPEKKRCDKCGDARRKAIVRQNQRDRYAKKRGIERTKLVKVKHYVAQHKHYEKRTLDDPVNGRLPFGGMDGVRGADRCESGLTRRLF